MVELADYLGVYGLGMENPGHGYAEGFGNTGQLHGYMTWAGCLPEEGGCDRGADQPQVPGGHLTYSHGLARPLVGALLRLTVQPTPVRIGSSGALWHNAGPSIALRSSVNVRP